MPQTDTANRQGLQPGRWRFRFYWLDVQQRLVFVSYPELSLREARVLRDECRSLVVRGIDPREHRRKAKLAKAADPSTSAFYFRHSH